MLLVRVAQLPGQLPAPLQQPHPARCTRWLGPFNQDATFCAQPGLSGSGVSFQSFNFPERYVRHATSELWIAGGAGSGSAWDSPASFTADATWNVASPWAP